MDSPSFKRRLLMNNFGEYEPDKYLATEDVEVQKAKHLKQAKAQKELLSKLKENVEALEEEFKTQNIESNEKYLDPDYKKGDDQRELEKFWNNRESDELKLWDILFEQAKRWIYEHKYELDNHWTIFDWMKLYSEAFQEYGLDMNMTMRVVK